LIGGDESNKPNLDLSWNARYPKTCALYNIGLNANAALKITEYDHLSMCDSEYGIFKDKREALTNLIIVILGYFP
jgi:hypothetical protein